MRSASRILALCAACGAAPVVAQAPQIEITLGGCKAGVQLNASDAPLSQVLGRLSEALHFTLKIEEPLEQSVNLRLAATGPELVARLLGSHDRYMITTARDPRCPGRMRVARVWVLGPGRSAEVRADATTRQPRPSGPAPATAARQAGPPATSLNAGEQELRAAEAASRRLKDTYDAYVKRHGRPPPGVEQEEARP